MADINDLVGKHIHNLRFAFRRFRGRQVLAVEVSMSMEVIARLRHAKKPVDRFQSPVRLAIFIVNAKGRRMGNQNIQGASIAVPVQQQARNHAQGSKVRFRLRMLVRSIRSVLNGTAEAADQEILEPGDFQIQV